MPTQLPLVFDVPARGKAPRHWLDLSISERLAAMEAFGLPKFRADQISRHVFDGLSDDVTAWTDLPAAIRDDLKRQLFPALLTQVRRLTADRGRTIKTLWRLHDGSLLESVLMRYPSRSTLCISSQAGCGMACPFCATGQGGLKRNLSQAEIAVQAFAANRMLAAGEAAGDLERLLQHAADYCRRRAGAYAARIEALAEPLMIVLVGAVIFFVVLSVLLPIFDAMDAMM